MMLYGEDSKGRPVYDYAYVKKVYDEMGRLLHDDNEKRQGVASLAVALSEMLVPLIKVFAGCGLVRGLTLTLSGCGLISESSELYQVLYAASDVIFYCLPVFLGYTAGKTLVSEV